MDRVEFADPRQDVLGLCTGKQNSQQEEEEEEDFWFDLVLGVCSGKQISKKEGEENDLWFDLLLAKCRNEIPHKKEEARSRESRQGDVLNLKRKRSLSPPPSGNHNSDSETDSTPRQVPQKVDNPLPKSRGLADLFEIIHYAFKSNNFSPLKKEELVQKTCELVNMRPLDEKWCSSKIEEFESMFPDWLCSSKWESTGDVMYSLKKDFDLNSLRMRW